MTFATNAGVGKGGGGNRVVKPGAAARTIGLIPGGGGGKCTALVVANEAFLAKPFRIECD